MKRIILLVSVVLFCYHSYSQVPFNNSFGISKLEIFGKSKSPSVNIITIVDNLNDTSIMKYDLEKINKMYNSFVFVSSMERKDGMSSYAYIDYNTKPESESYRVKITKTSGEFKYTKIIIVNKN
jgi:hypothetical protein